MRNKLGQFIKGHKLNVGNRYALGYKHTEEAKKKISEVMKVRIFTEEHKKNLSKNNARYWLGKKHTEEHKRKIGLAHIGNTHGFKKGIHYSLENEFKKGHGKGEKNVNWKGGITPIRIKSINSQEYKDWRIAIFKRDNFICLNCGKIGGCLESHHIYSWVDYPKLRYEIENGATLCKDCHNLTKLVPR